MKSNRLSVLRAARLCVCAAVCVAVLASCGGKGKALKIVQNGVLSTFSDVPLGKVMNKGLSGAKWSAYASADKELRAQGLRYVDVKGKLLVKGEKVPVFIEFDVNIRTGAFQTSKCLLAGEELGSLDRLGLLGVIYEVYDAKTNKGKDKAGKSSSQGKEGKAKDGAKKKGITVTKAENLSYKLSDDNESVVVTGFKDVDKTAVVKLVVPAVIEDMSVTAIKNIAFEDCDMLKTVELPDSVTSIGDSAFYRCKALESIKLPSSLTEIEDSIFYECSSLKSIVLPDSVSKIGIDAFRGCSSLKSVTLPASIAEIEQSAFLGCSSLKAINLPDGITKIDNEAFAGCSALEAIALPDSITELGSEMFSGCKSLKSAKLPSSLEEIGGRMFEGCSSLKSISIPDSVKAIRGLAFSGCTALESANLPASLEYGRFASDVFENCTSLKNLTIPDGLSVDSDEYRSDDWKYHTFDGCTSLPLKTQAALKKLGYKGFD